MERLLSEIVEKLRKAHGDALVSVVLYGSAAAAEGHDARSDYNILCVLRQVTPDELLDAEPVFRWWREMKNPAPLLLGMEELRTSADSFPIEFHDIRERHRILFGDDVVSGIEIDDSFYRAYVEHELRARLLRLRQKAGGLLSQPDLLLRLMLDSVSTFCVLFRHVLCLAGEQPRFAKREIVEAARKRFGIGGTSFDNLLVLREGKMKVAHAGDPVGMFRSYLDDIGVVIRAVDALEK